ncbi:zf-HC2 domain-containing protein [Chromohalobacter nigrandesensis]|uniref:zf-HC2 domain-containing protein n=1 Tax=Chromohalobacter nigrandesensis TaxID=119863 RepID=UPI00248C03B7|nr:zf-HC2 domain-containing protein [Chromohalobacter nigrandesensis]
MCREATRLMSKNLDAPLGFQERMSLKFHLAMCGACRKCNQQFQLIHDAGKAFEAKESSPPFDTDDQTT